MKQIERHRTPGLHISGAGPFQRTLKSAKRKLTAKTATAKRRFSGKKAGGNISKIGGPPKLWLAFRCNDGPLWGFLETAPPIIDKPTPGVCKMPKNGTHHAELVGKLQPWGLKACGNILFSHPEWTTANAGARRFLEQQDVCGAQKPAGSEKEDVSNQ